MDTRALGAATVLDTDGSAVPLAREWADRPVVVVWLRHFGCVFCREQVAQPRPERIRRRLHQRRLDHRGDAFQHGDVLRIAFRVVRAELRDLALVHRLVGAQHQIAAVRER